MTYSNVYIMKYVQIGNNNAINVLYSIYSYLGKISFDLINRFKKGIGKFEFTGKKNKGNIM